MPEATYLVRYLGAGTYRGYDPGLRCHIEVQPMELVLVSDQKREQLLADFGSEWEEYGEAAPLAAPGEADNVLQTPLPAPRRRRPARTKPHAPEATKG